MQNSGMGKLLAKQFPNPQAVISEIINLSAILNLPKGTEHFLSDFRSETRLLKSYERRILVKETDDGKRLMEQIEVLKRFLAEYYHYPV